MPDHCRHTHGNSYENPGIYSHSSEIRLVKGVFGSKITECLTAWIQELIHWSEEKHYHIGHIKTFTTSGESLNLWLASTGKAINAKSSDQWAECQVRSFTINMTIIIFGPEQQLLQEVVQEKLTKEITAYLC